MDQAMAALARAPRCSEAARTAGKDACAARARLCQLATDSADEDALLRCFHADETCAAADARTRCAP